jgi:hypothetical protein
LEDGENLQSASRFHASATILSLSPFAVVIVTISGLIATGKEISKVYWVAEAVILTGGYFEEDGTRRA